MAEPAPEFSRPITAERIPPSGIEQSIEAKPAERAALAKRFDLVELKKLKAELTLTPGRQHSVTIIGTVTADIVQSCVITLEPVASHFDLDIDMILIPAAENRGGAGSPDPDEGDEDVETFSGGKIDIGELAAQQLGVSIDPYPRKKGAALGSIEFGIKSDKPNPMAALVKLTDKKKNPKNNKT